MKREIFRMALHGISANKLRSSLTVLGMSIGVAAVILLIAVGNGSAAAVTANITNLGTNLLSVEASPSLNTSGTETAAISLNMSDVTALNNHQLNPNVKDVSPVVNVDDPTLTAGSTSYSPSSMVGTTPTYLAAHDYTIAEGANFTQHDVSDHDRVVVVGPEVVSELYGGESPVGETLLINGVSFQIVGVTAAKGGSDGTDEDDVVFTPVTAAQDNLTGYGNLDSITFSASSSNNVGAAESEATQTIDAANNVSTTSDAGFEIVSQDSLLSAVSSTSSVFTTLLAEVAAISLLVGGIGVMNIMLVSVTERTREIGIRKAVGARRSDILAQFLTEAVLISLFGALLGIAIGCIGSQLTIAGVHPVIAVYSIVLAFGASLLIGLFFGTYPATRAAALRPIDALRFE